MPMEEMDTNTLKFDSPYHIDYDDLLEHVIQNDHELLYLDTYLHDVFSIEAAG